MKGIVDATVPYASMFKPQSAHWEAIRGGRLALQVLVRYIHRKYPEVPVFLDCKRGDIGATQSRYRDAHFLGDGIDGMNFSPYMGEDCMRALVGEPSKNGAIVGLCYTSNSTAREVQDLELLNGQKLWEWMAVTIKNWAEKLGVVENAGLVMAAAYDYPKGSGIVYSEHLRRCRELVGDSLWFLIPGAGTQGGFVEKTVKAAYVGTGSMAVNSSSGISEASSGADWREAAAGKAKELADQTWTAIPRA
jgi:orotidine 5'-phosphate decarboxylase subfamily 2